MNDTDISQKSQLYRILFYIILLFIFCTGTYILFQESEKWSTQSNKAMYSKELRLATVEPVDDVIVLETTVENLIDSRIRELHEQFLQRQEDIEFQAKVDKVESMFSRYGGYMSGLGPILVSRAEECGGDYRLLAAIAGNESGFGRIPYKLYNPFGYLDGVQYSSWEDAIYTLSCKISQQHLAPCNNVVSCVVRRYGGSDTDKDKWVRNITWFIHQL